MSDFVHCDKRANLISPCAFCPKEKWTPSNELIATMSATLYADGGVTAKTAVEMAKEICRLIGEE
mgnify:CR=1 FL=1